MAELADRDHSIATRPGGPHSDTPEDDWVGIGDDHPVLAFLQERRSQLVAGNRDLLERLETLAEEAGGLQDLDDRSRTPLTTERGELHTPGAQPSPARESLDDVQSALSELRELRRRLEAELRSREPEAAMTGTAVAKQVKRPRAVDGARLPLHESHLRRGLRNQLDSGIMKSAAGILLAAIVFLSSGLVGRGRFGEGPLIDPLRLGKQGGSDSLLRPGWAGPWETEPEGTEIQKVERVVKRSEVGHRDTQADPRDSSSRSTSRREPPEPRTPLQQGSSDEPKAAPQPKGGDPQGKGGAPAGKPDEDAPPATENDKGAPAEDVGPPEAADKADPDAGGKADPGPPEKKKDPPPASKEKNPKKDGSAEDGEG